MEGLMVREIKWKRERWRIGTVYITGKQREILGRITELNANKEGEKGWIVGEDLNARTGEKGARAIENGEEGREKKSKDKKVNRLEGGAKEKGW